MCWRVWIIKNVVSLDVIKRVKGVLDFKNPKLGWIECLSRLLFELNIKKNTLGSITK